MEGKDRPQHMLALKVMRLTRPSIHNPLIVGCEKRDLPGDSFDEALRNDVAALPNLERLALGQFMVLPQSFGKIYLGEMFSCYIYVQNISSLSVQHVTVQLELETPTQKIHLLSSNDPTLPKGSSMLAPRDTVDRIVQHEIKELGKHSLNCEIQYETPSGEQMSFSKFFTFPVLKPLDIKTKFYNTESDDVYLEAQVENLTVSSIFLEKVELVPSNLFVVTSLNTYGSTAGSNDVEDISLFAPVGSLASLCSRQYLYCLTPKADMRKNLPFLRGVTNVGKLDIVWRTQYGQQGRLQTSPLQSMAADHGELRLMVVDLPNVVELEKAFTFTCRITSCCDRAKNLSVSMEITGSLLWSGLSNTSLPPLETGKSIEFPLEVVPSATGLHTISGLRITDIGLNKVYDYDNLAQVLVIREVGDKL